MKLNIILTLFLTINFSPDNYLLAAQKAPNLPDFKQVEDLKQSIAECLSDVQRNAAIAYANAIKNYWHPLKGAVLRNAFLALLGSPSEGFSPRLVTEAFFNARKAKSEPVVYLLVTLMPTRKILLNNERIHHPLKGAIQNADVQALMNKEYKTQPALPKLPIDPSFDVMNMRLFLYLICNDQNDALKQMLVLWERLNFLLYINVHFREDFFKAFCFAAEKGFSTTIKHLLTNDVIRHALINYYPRKNLVLIALENAASNGHYETVKLLLTHFFAVTPLETLTNIFTQESLRRALDAASKGGYPDTAMLIRPYFKDLDRMLLILNSHTMA